MANPIRLRPITSRDAMDLFEQALASTTRENYYPGAIIALVRLVEAEIQHQIYKAEHTRQHDAERRADKRERRDAEEA